MPNPPEKITIHFAANGAVVGENATTHEMADYTLSSSIAEQVEAEKEKVNQFIADIREIASDAGDNRLCSGEYMSDAIRKAIEKFKAVGELPEEGERC